MTLVLKDDLRNLAKITRRFSKHPLFDRPEMPSTDRIPEEIQQEFEEEIEHEIAEFEKANSTDWDHPKIVDVLLDSEPFITMRSDTFIYLLPRLILFALEQPGRSEMMYSTADFVRFRLKTEGVLRLIDETFSAQEKLLLSRAQQSFERELLERRKT